MKPNRKIAIILACLMTLSIIVARGSDRSAKLGEVRTLALPSFATLDESAQPVISPNGKVGFVSSVKGGSLISFNLSSGRLLSTVVVGEAAGPISIIETAGLRLIAVPAVNNPANGHPATVSIIDATKSKRLELKSLLVLPTDAFITTATRALLTGDGRHCLIASASEKSELYSFDVETGALISRLSLGGRASEAALHDRGERRLVAVTSSAANELSIIKVDEQGRLAALSSFTPAGAQFDESNNPAFSSDGRMVFIAVARGDAVYMVDAESGIQIDLIGVESPHRITTGRGPGGSDLVAATRIRRPINSRPGGVSIIRNESGRLLLQAEFTPPDGVEFSRANNVAFAAGGGVAFVGSRTGVLFAFDTDTGELQSYHAMGGELRRLALGEKANSIAAVRSSEGGDEIAILGFDLLGSVLPDPTAPLIEQLSPDVVEQGRLNNLQISVAGKNFTEGASLVINGVEVAADITRGGASLEAKLPRSLFDQPRVMSIQIKGADGSLSEIRELRVIRPGAPVIESMTPAEIAGPRGAFTLRLKGRNFRPSSTIVVADHTLDTHYVREGELRAQVPAELARSLGSLKVQVKDLAVADLASANEKEIRIHGPRITGLQTNVSAVVAGDGSFELKIRGENFRSGALVLIGGKEIPSNRIRIISRNQIAVTVPRELYQEAGSISVVVRNPEGGSSEAAELAVSGPEIQRIGSGKVFAASSSVNLTIRGKNFRRGARVYVGNENGAYQVSKRRVRFLSSRRVAVTLDGELSRMLREPGALRFSIVNPNSGDGVRSADHILNVVGPTLAGVRIKPHSSLIGDEFIELAIDGANFRRGAIVEFIKDGGVVRQQAPVYLDGARLSVLVPASAIEALGSFNVRVVNPGNIASIESQPRFEVAASSNQ